MAGDRLADVRYHAFGGPELIAACEHVARSAEGEALAELGEMCAVDWLAALRLSRDSLAPLLVLEDAWRELIAALGAGTNNT